MPSQDRTYPVSSLMLLGVAGGNGLEHISPHKFEKVYGVDVNADYLKAAARRYPDLEGTLECLRVNLLEEADRLPKAEMVVANLLIEYIGYECFQKVIRQVDPQYVSCVIQINMEDSWVSDSPYLHIFDGLEEVHYQMEEDALKKSMSEMGYPAIKTLARMLPNGKKFVQMDFERQNGRKG